MRLSRILIVLSVLLVPAVARAQVNTLELDNPRENAKFRLGPFYSTLRLGLTELGTDNNVFNERDERKSDFTFTLTPNGTFWLPLGRRALIKTIVSADAVYYREYDSERSVDSNIGVRVEKYFPRITLFGAGSLTFARQRPNTDIDVRTRRVDQTYDFGVDTRITPKISFQLSASRQKLAFDADAPLFGSRLRDALDRTTVTLAGVVRYRYSALTTLGVRGERFETRFAHSIDRDNDNVRVMAGVELRPRALINGSAWIGVRHLNPIDEQALPEFAGLVSDLTLVYSARGAMMVEVRHKRDVDYSFELLHPYFVNQEFRGRVRRALGPKFDVEVEGWRGSAAYRTLVFLESILQRDDVNNGYGGSLGYHFGRAGRVGVGLVFSRRDSNFDFHDFQGLRIRTTVTYGF